MLNNVEEVNYGFDLKAGIDHSTFIEFKESYKTITERRYKRWLKLRLDQVEPSRKLKRFIRKGIPSELRKKMWIILAGVEKKIQTNDIKYTDYVSMEISSKDKKVISADVPRTFPDNPLFRTDSEKSKSLERVLIAFVAKHPDIGYCQGLNFIAAVILLVIEDEESSFWIMNYLIDEKLPDYYSIGMVALKIDCLVLEQLLKKKIPKVLQKIQELSSNCTAMCTAWFICLYIDILPIETSLRIMDCLLYEGDKLIFRVALALFQTFANDIIKSESFPELAVSFQHMLSNPTVLHCHEFMEKCFTKPDPLSYKTISKLRKDCSNMIE